MDTLKPAVHPQTRRHLINAERLVKAAIREFASQGFHGAKISSIVALAELSQPSFYRVWASKEAAYDEIISSTNTIWQEAAFSSLTLDGEGPISSLLERGVLHLFQTLTLDLDLTRLVLRHNAQDDPHNLYVGIYEARFTALQQAGRISPTQSPELLAQVYTALTERLLYARLLNRSATPAEAARELTTILLPLLLTD